MSNINRKMFLLSVLLVLVALFTYN